MHPIGLLEVLQPLRIVGAPEVPTHEIVVVGGCFVIKAPAGADHLQHMIIAGSGLTNTGVEACVSFTMKDVIVEQCGNCGVSGFGVVGTCTNVQVRRCALWVG